MQELRSKKTQKDSSFPLGQLLTDGIKTPFRLDRNQNGVEILLYQKDILAKLSVDHNLVKYMKNIFSGTSLISKNMASIIVSQIYYNLLIYTHS